MMKGGHGQTKLITLQFLLTTVRTTGSFNMQSSCRCVSVYDLNCLRVCVTTAALWCVTTSTYGLSGCLHTGTVHACSLMMLSACNLIQR